VTFANRHQYQMRFGRFSTEVPTPVEARTFGSEEPYRMKTINVSKTGLLLASPPGFRVPFNESTLLELTLFLEEQPIRCLGKVLRCEVDFEKKIKRYGINICDIHAEDCERYFSFIEDTEHRKNRQVFRALNIPMPI
jgi:c-di-GMP-binding flagellar brake protein YcgR